MLRTNSRHHHKGLPMQQHQLKHCKWLYMVVQLEGVAWCLMTCTYWTSELVRIRPSGY